VIARLATRLLPASRILDRQRRVASTEKAKGILQCFFDPPSISY